jgi:hydrogenase nickel incorporation protein HypA/HybF
MHEIYITNQIVQTVLAKLEKYDVKKVESITLEIGELTLIADDQLNFAYDILTRNTILENSKLLICRKRTLIECSCGYKGSIDYSIGPMIVCPICGSNKISVLEGNECTLKNIKFVV